MDDLKAGNRLVITQEYRDWYCNQPHGRQMWLGDVGEVLEIITLAPAEEDQYVYMTCYRIPSGVGLHLGLVPLDLARRMKQTYLERICG